MKKVRTEEQDYKYIEGVEGNLKEALNKDETRKKDVEDTYQLEQLEESSENEEFQTKLMGINRGQGTGTINRVQENKLLPAKNSK